MKKMFFSILIIFLGLIADAQPKPAQPKPAQPKTTIKPAPEVDSLKPPAGDAKRGEWYGEKVVAERASDEINNIVKQLDYGAKVPAGKFTAKILDVCPRDGCRVKLELKEGRSAFLIIKDTAAFFPLAAKGRKVLIDGVVEIKEISVEELKKYAKHLKKSKEIVEAISKTEKQVWVTAKGVLLLDGDVQTVPDKINPTTSQPVTTKPVKEEDTVKPPPAGDARPGEWYGEKFNTNSDAFEIDKIVSDLSKGLFKSNIFSNGNFYAKISEVCPRDGCRLKLELKDGSKAVVIMRDNTVFFPLAAKGKKVRIDGSVEVKTISVEELKQYAAHLKKPKEEIDAITKPEKEVRVMAKGIVVVE